MYLYTASIGPNGGGEKIVLGAPKKYRVISTQLSDGEADTGEGLSCKLKLKAGGAALVVVE